MKIKSNKFMTGLNYWKEAGWLKCRYIFCILHLKDNKGMKHNKASCVRALNPERRIVISHRAKFQEDGT